MEQDIRDLFKQDESKKELPQDHREEFLEKLNRLKRKKESKINFNYLYKIAAVILLFVSVGYFAINRSGSNPKIVEETNLETQIKEVEKKYLASIDEEWQNFLTITDDEKLVKRYEKKLEELNIDYQEMSTEFKKDTKNILVIEALVENLQTRLQLLKDIQEHINLLNQKTEQHETISI